MSIRTEVAKRLHRQVADERATAEREFIEREARIAEEAALAERNAAAVAAAEAEAAQFDRDATGAARLCAVMEGLELDIAALGTPEERFKWLTVTGLSVNALSLAASAGSIAPYLDMPNLDHASSVDNLRLPRPHVRHLLAIQAAHKLYTQRLSQDEQAREEQLQADRRAALDAEADRLLAQRDAAYAQQVADIARLEG